MPQAKDSDALVDKLRGGEYDQIYENLAQTQEALMSSQYCLNPLSGQVEQLVVGDYMQACKAQAAKSLAEIRAERLADLKCQGVENEESLQHTLETHEGIVFIVSREVGVLNEVIEGLRKTFRGCRFPKIGSTNLPQLLQALDIREFPHCLVFRRGAVLDKIDARQLIGLLKGDGRFLDAEVGFGRLANLLDTWEISG